MDRPLSSNYVEAISLKLDLEPGDRITGLARSNSMKEGLRFSGWTELMMVIDTLRLSTESASTDDDSSEKG
jgi:hypothetical protein